MTYKTLQTIEQFAGRLTAEQVARDYTMARRAHIQRMVDRRPKPRGLEGDVLIVLGGGLCGLVWGSIIADAIPNILSFISPYV